MTGVAAAPTVLATRGPDPSPMPLVSGDWLEDRFDDPDVVVVEVDEEASVYHRGHVPGAHNLDWLDDLHHPVRRRFLDQDAFARLMDRLGVRQDSHVVFYGDTHNVFAASAYWLFRYYGHRSVSLLDGGRRLWLLEDRELSDEEPHPVGPPGRGYRVRQVHEEFRARRDQVLERFVGAPPGTAVVDCRTPQEYAGKRTESVDLPVENDRSRGHIPGAVNLSSSELADPDTDRLLPAERLRQMYLDRGVTDDLDVVVYCRVAERSALLWFTLHEVLGHRSVLNYDGGWAEYGNLIDVPIAR